MPCTTLVRSFFFNDTATTEIYTLSLHDALPIYANHLAPPELRPRALPQRYVPMDRLDPSALDMRAVLKDRKSTRLNSSHANISYAVFCLKKKKTPTSTLQSRQYLVTSLCLHTHT